ncbi:MAG: hypothetical protein GY812_06535 [Actinomycetia bacterium]|nr:hypothetical protein [Actinomycetes bacterium]
MEQARSAPNRQAFVTTLWWWFITLLVLVILDDLTFGPFFWLIARLAGAVWAMLAVYAVYIPVQLFLVSRGTRDEPGRVAHWFLSRLDLERRYRQVQDNESKVRSRVAGGVSAVLTCLIIGGVLPPLLLWRQGFERRYVMQIAGVCSVVYATEFALLHGLVPAVI